MLSIGHKPPSQKGVIRSAETRKRISVAKEGHSHSLETRQKMSVSRRGERNSFFKRTHTDEAKRRMSAHKIGKRPHNYIEDRTLVKLDTDRGGPLHKEWSKSVKARDGWKCRLSNSECSGNLVAHHIRSWAQYPRLRYKIKNGITLCHVHHPRKRADEQRTAPLFIAMVRHTA